MPDKKRTRPYDVNNAGAISVMEAEIVFGAAAKRQLIGTVPAGGLIINCHVEVLEAFNAGTSNLVTMGYGAIAAGTADDFVPSVTEGTPGVYGQATPGLPFAVAATDTDVYLYYTPGAADATTGKARGFVQFARLADNG